MAKDAPPRFSCLKDERAFWDEQDAFDVLGEDDWEIAEEGDVQVRSVYIARIGKRGAAVRLPKDMLDQIGAKRSVKARVEGKRLIVEA